MQLFTLPQAVMETNMHRSGISGSNSQVSVLHTLEFPPLIVWVHNYIALHIPCMHVRVSYKGGGGGGGDGDSKQKITKI